MLYAGASCPLKHILLPERRAMPQSLPPLSDSPRIDLLIATLGRKKELDRLFSSLEEQSYPNFQIFLADQNPSGYLDDILERRSGLPVTRVMLPSRGVSIARNALLERATGDVVVFPDDDCWYAPDVLQRALEAFRAHPSCGALLGVWTASPEARAPMTAEGRVYRTGLFHLAGTCVQFYRREAVTGLLFDPLLGPGTGLPYGCGEDTDYMLYAHARTEIRRCRGIQVFHPSPEKNPPSLQKVAEYAAGRMYLLKKHKFSMWFMLANVLYPLFMAPLDAVRYSREHGRYRWRMFRERLRNF